MKVGVTAAIIVGLVGLCSAALGIEGEVYGLYSPLRNVNGLIEQHEAAASIELPALHVGFGGALRADLFPILGEGVLYFGGRGAAYSVEERDTELRTSHVGIVVGMSYPIGRLIASADLGLYRGSFAFPSARYADSSGWSGGVSGTATYRLQVTARLAVGASVLAQWVPFNEMADSEGQTYRGRGTPFVDFGGIGGSIHLVWDF